VQGQDNQANPHHPAARPSGAPVVRIYRRAHPSGGDPVREAPYLKKSFLAFQGKVWFHNPCLPGEGGREGIIRASGPRRGKRPPREKQSGPRQRESHVSPSTSRTASASIVSPSRAATGASHRGSGPPALQPSHHSLCAMRESAGRVALGTSPSGDRFGCDQTHLGSNRPTTGKAHA
jgi:hypothetical protein